MRKRFRSQSHRRPPRRRPKAKTFLSDVKFTATVAAVAAAAFAGALMWPGHDQLKPPVDFPPLQIPISASGSNPTRHSAPAGAAGSSQDFECEVAYVNDGDTLRCADGTRVRLHAISARETDGSCSPGHPCSQASAESSTAALRRLARGRITCVRTGSSFNRVTAICENAQGVEINCAMVKSGAAEIWERFNRQQPICRS